MSVNTKVNGQLVKSAGLYKVSVPIQSGDIYSFEERQVGVWTDGKPLYQKTIHFGALPNRTTKEVAHGIENVDAQSFVSIEGTASVSSYALSMPKVHDGNSNVFSQCFFEVSSTNVKCYARTQDLSAFDCYMTLKYTKTTDVAGSGEYVPSGDKAVHYDDTEQVIGTWFGETLYRKSLKLPNTITCASNAWTDTGLTIQNVSRVIKGEVLRNGTQSFALSINSDNNAIKVQSYYNSTLTLDSNTYVTLEYTKTS